MLGPHLTRSLHPKQRASTLPLNLQPLSGLVQAPVLCGPSLPNSFPFNPRCHLNNWGRFFPLCRLNPRAFFHELPRIFPNQAHLFLAADYLLPILGQSHFCGALHATECSKNLLNLDNDGSNLLYASLIFNENNIVSSVVEPMRFSPQEAVVMILKNQHTLVLKTAMPKDESASIMLLAKEHELCDILIGSKISFVLACTCTLLLKQDHANILSSGDVVFACSIHNVGDTSLDGVGNATEVAHAAANRWTDNIFALQHWCSSNFPEAKERLEHLYKEVGITDSLDYLE
eukprot:Gb_40478 [translate_table: standard]